jgi:hypothetical protein
MPTDEGTLGVSLVARPPAQPHGRPWRQFQRLPSRDGPRACLGLLIVLDAREQPAQLDRSSELTALIERRANCRSFFFGDDEHHLTMGTLAAPGKPA